MLRNQIADGRHSLLQREMNMVEFDLNKITGNEPPLKTDDDKDAEIDWLKQLLFELHATVMGECPALLNEDSGGNATLALEIEEALGSAAQRKVSK
jgi:hypothetical protein